MKWHLVSKQQGFTLIEQIIVIAIIGIVTAIAGLQYSSRIKKGQLEGQVRTMYTDLADARSQALFRKKPSSVVITSTAYNAYSSNVISGNPVRSQVLKIPVTPAKLQIDFDQSGVATFNQNPALLFGEICVQTSNIALNDSVVVGRTQTQVGKLKTGMGCSSVNITRN